MRLEMILKTQFIFIIFLFISIFLCDWPQFHQAVDDFENSIYIQECSKTRFNLIGAESETIFTWLVSPLKSCVHCARKYFYGQNISGVKALIKGFLLLANQIKGLNQPFSVNGEDDNCLTLKLFRQSSKILDHSWGLNIYG